MLHRTGQRFLFAVVAVFLATAFAHASGANFTLSAVGVILGKPVDENAEIPKYRVKVEVGQTITLTAQGMVLPRGAPPLPSEPDATAWLFDDAAFQLAAHEKAKADKTKAVIALKAAKTGQTRIRFVGNILGREQKYDILVEILEAKK